MIIIDTSSLGNQNISTALLCHTYTAKADRQIFVRLFFDQVAGGGDYVGYITLQKLGAGSFYTSIKTTNTLGAGVTSGFLSTIPISVKETDVVKVYLLGLAGDINTPDIITEIWDADPLTQFQGTAQAGSAANTIVLAAAGSPATNNLINGAVVRIRGGTGVGQARVIIGYVAATQVATVGRNWAVTPDNTSVYEIVGLSVPRVTDNIEAYSNVTAWQGVAPAALTAANLVQADAIKLNGAVPNNAPAAPTMITGQQVRDAMKLAPSAGAPAAGSIDDLVTTVLAKIGAFAGTGVNTILGFLRAMANKAGAIATPSELSAGGTFTNTTDSEEAIADSVGGLTPAINLGVDETDIVVNP